MHYFFYFVAIRFEVGDKILGSDVFDELGNTKYFWYNHVQD
jgi:hypothetical protein